jgi:hypothetical protein
MIRKNNNGRSKTLIVCFFIMSIVPGMVKPAHAQTCTYAAGFQFIESKDTTHPSTTLAKPVKGQWYKDPAYGACITRATDYKTEGTKNAGMRNDYSRRNPFNADHSRFFTYEPGGIWHLYDANTLTHIGAIPGPGGDAEPQWHPSNPALLYWIPTNGGLVINLLNVTSNVNSVAADFLAVKGIRGQPGVTSIKTLWPGAVHCWTKSEGSPSADGRYWGFLVNDANWGLLGFFVYDMVNDSIVGTRTDTNMPDHCSMSPSGRWFVVSGDTTYCLPRDLSGSPVFMLGGSEHSDLGLNGNGEDVYVYSHYGSFAPSSSVGFVAVYNLDTRERFNLWSLYENSSTTSTHISCKAFNNPGWVLISTYGHLTEPFRWFRTKIMAVEMKQNPRIFNIAHTYNNGETYWTETHAATSRDFTRILFNSNWNAGATVDDVDAYMAVLPAGIIGGPAGISTNFQTKETGPATIRITSGGSISYHVNRIANVRIRIHNTLGRCIGTFEMGRLTPGDYSMKLAALFKTRKMTIGRTFVCTVTIGDKTFARNVVWPRLP